MSPVVLEICIDSVESALAATLGGAQRVELCSDLLEGGITPSAGLIEEVRARTAIALHVIARPRGGDFCYSAEEFQIMKRDIRLAKQLGVDGFSLGILLPDGTIDVERTTTLVELANPLPVTFHRAFDMTANLSTALEDVIQCGVRRVLTSGGVPSAVEGLPTIAELVRLANERIVVMVCGGVRQHNAAQILRATGAHELHANPRTWIDGPMRFRNRSLSLSPDPDREFQRAQVQEEDVRLLFEAAQSARPRDDRP